MAQRRPEISGKIKKQLKREAGDKCANPGCPNKRTHFHHIKEWAVYETHDAQHMIAICPACHDAVHFGELPISDTTIYEWKKITRPSSSIRGHLYIEPGNPTKVLLGTIAIATPQEAIIFELNHSNQLRFKIVDKDILLLDLIISTLHGKEILRVTNNHLRHELSADIVFKQVVGHIQLTVPATTEFIPEWVIQKMQTQDPSFAKDGYITMLSLEVIRAGLIRVEGVWAEHDYAVVVTPKQLSFLTPTKPFPISIIGEGEESVLRYLGPINKALFNFS